MNELIEFFKKKKSGERLFHMELWGYEKPDGSIDIRLVNPITELPLKLFSKIATTLNDVQEWYNHSVLPNKEKEEKK